MDIEVTATATTVAVAAVEVVRTTLVAALYFLEQEKALVRPQPRLSHLHAPYVKKHFILEDLSDNICEFHFR